MYAVPRTGFSLSAAWAVAKIEPAFFSGACKQPDHSNKKAQRQQHRHGFCPLFLFAQILYTLRLAFCAGQGIVLHQFDLGRNQDFVTQGM